MKFLLVGILLLIPVLFVMGRLDERRALRDWRFALSPRAKRLLDKHNKRVADELEVESALYDGAKASRRRADLDTPGILGAWLEVLNDIGHGGLRLLRVMGRVVRIAAVAVPLRPIRLDLESSLWFLAAGAAVVHYVLVSTVDQFHLRLWTLRVGLRRAHAIAKARAHQAGTATENERHWRRLDRVRRDHRRLNEEVLTSLEAAFLSASAERKSLPSRASVPAPTSDSETATPRGKPSPVKKAAVGNR